ncbi:hypothetical protein Tco_0733875 [Tanacetum coccineum]
MDPLNGCPSACLHEWTYSPTLGVQPTGGSSIHRLDLSNHLQRRVMFKLLIEFWRHSSKHQTRNFIVTIKKNNPIYKSLCISSCGRPRRILLHSMDFGIMDSDMAQRFATWMGVEVRARVSYLKGWKQVTTQELDQLWLRAKGKCAKAKANALKNTDRHKMGQTSYVRLEKMLAPIMQDSERRYPEIAKLECRRSKLHIFGRCSTIPAH